MSDTPRTDYLYLNIQNMDDHVDSAFAKMYDRAQKLERELAAANKGAERNAKVNQLLAKRVRGLQERLAAVFEETRERCAKVCDEVGNAGGREHMKAAMLCKEVIRALSAKESAQGQENAKDQMSAQLLDGDATPAPAAAPIANSKSQLKRLVEQGAIEFNGFTLGATSSCLSPPPVTVVCDWANTKKEQEAMHELAWAAHNFYKKFCYPIRITVSKNLTNYFTDTDSCLL